LDLVLELDIVLDLVLVLDLEVQVKADDPVEGQARRAGSE